MSSPQPRVIDVTNSDAIAQAVEKTGLQPKALLILLGDFAATAAAEVQSICSRAFAPLAAEAGALIVDKGTGPLSAAIGQAARAEDQSPLLLGIAASGADGLDPNHPLVLRLPPEWSDPVKARSQIAAEFAKDGKPVVAVLFGGAEAEKAAVIQCARREWPVLLIQGSGGLADQIIAATAPPAGSAPTPIADPVLREIAETATLPAFTLGGSMDDLRSTLLAHIERRTETLADAWALYDDLDHAAVNKQRLFKRLQTTILSLAVLATLLAVVLSNAALPPEFTNLIPAWLKTFVNQKTLHWLMVITPIAVSVLVAANSRFREGNKWILLRAAGEAVKREIFRYRTQAGDYSDEKCKQTSRESKLAAKMKDITSALAQSEVNKSSLPSLTPAKPERLTFLSPAEYLTNRVEDQINHMVGKTERLYRQLKTLQTCIYVVGGLGTLFAAFNGDVWVAFTTAIAAALTTKLESEQVETSLVQYNQALFSLRNIQSWWNALTRWQKGRAANVDLLVDQTEKTMESELAGWVQQMQTTLEKLTEKETEPAPKKAAASA